jgi:hypothetical protein
MEASLTIETVALVGAVVIALLVAWLVLKLVARLIVTAVLVGALVVGLVVAAGWLTDQPPARIVDSAVATVTAGATRTARDGNAPSASEPPRTVAPARP